MRSGFHSSRILYRLTLGRNENQPKPPILLRQSCKLDCDSFDILLFAEKWNNDKDVWHLKWWGLGQLHVFAQKFNRPKGAREAQKYLHSQQPAYNRKNPRVELHWRRLLNQFGYDGLRLLD